MRSGREAPTEGGIGMTGETVSTAEGENMAMRESGSMAGIGGMLSVTKMWSTRRADGVTVTGRSSIFRGRVVKGAGWSPGGVRIGTEAVPDEFDSARGMEPLLVMGLSAAVIWIRGSRCSRTVQTKACTITAHANFMWLRVCQGSSFTLNLVGARPGGLGPFPLGGFAPDHFAYVNSSPLTWSLNYLSSLD